jgi:putative thioredoxin
MLELGGGQQPQAGAAVIDGTDAGFMTDVIEASNTTPVVVQFTAAWCGPCKTLGPQLEAAVAKTGGKVKMVRIDIDQHQQIAGQLQVQSIPAVFGFVGGRPVDAFMGAQPPSEIDRFVGQLASDAGPTDMEAQITEALDMADEKLAGNGAAEAAQVYAQVLGADRENLRAITGMARCYVATGDLERATETLGYVPEDKADDPTVTQVRSMIALAEQAGSADDNAALETAIASNPDDHQSRYDLAVALVAGGREEEGIDHLLELFRRDREWNEDAARQKLFEIFDALGPKNPAALKGRRRLSSLVLA